MCHLSLLLKRLELCAKSVTKCADFKISYRYLESGETLKCTFYMNVSGLVTSRKKNYGKSVWQRKARFWGFCTHQQGLNAASTDHIWKSSPLNGFNYHQLASTQVLGHQWAVPSNSTCCNFIGTFK